MIATAGISIAGGLLGFTLGPRSEVSPLARSQPVSLIGDVDWIAKDFVARSSAPAATDSRGVLSVDSALDEVVSTAVEGYDSGVANIVARIVSDSVAHNIGAQAELAMYFDYMERNLLAAEQQRLANEAVAAEAARAAAQVEAARIAALEAEAARVAAQRATAPAAAPAATQQRTIQRAQPLAAPAPVAAAPVAAPPVTAAPVPVAGDATEVLDRLNALRASLGLPALSTHPTLMAAAQNQANAIAGAGRLYHQDLKHLLGSFSRAGENVGFGPSVASVHEGLVRSPGHYANMVNAQYTSVGVAVVTTADGRVWVAQVFGG